jgi:hypothetical protein
VPKRRVASDNLQTVAYNARRKTLTVTYRSQAIYRFDGVPKRTVDGLLKASSKTHFMQTRVAPKYDATRIRKWRTRK